MAHGIPLECIDARTPWMVGAAALVRGLAEAFAVVPLLNQLLSWDPRHCRLSPGERILALILDILTRRSLLVSLSGG